jgi:acetyl esterase/lipase
MGLVRLHAAEWHIDPHKIGVLGFSAGGHLVADISTHFAHRLYPAVDAADKESCRPDFAVALMRISGFNSNFLPPRAYKCISTHSRIRHTVLRQHTCDPLGR